MEHGDANVQCLYARETHRNNRVNSKEPESSHDPRPYHKRSRERNTGKSIGKKTLGKPLKTVVGELNITFVELGPTVENPKPSNVEKTSSSRYDSLSNVEF